MDGFERIEEREVRELNTRAIRYHHKHSGADILFLKNRDENKVFGITFRTPPKDATGLPHILEHSVLCGSRKYPVKEPFVELLKGSLQTFLNAFTYPDKTCYPVASTHEKDFHNLVDVYLDAVFFPLLKEEIFLQEGWHYHMEDPNARPEIRGVVYNEMKGAYSSPERVLAETIQQSLFPDHPYAFDSGGDPLEIPELSYEDFIDYHRKFYHPSNARIFFYGNGSMEAELSWIAPYLESFSAISVPSSIPDLKPWRGLRKVRKTYATMPGKKAERKTYATLNWLLPETTETVTNFSLQILHHILIGTPGSPLRRALIESGLGEDLVGGGLETELRWMFFAVGLKGMSESRVDDMVNIIEDTIARLVREGIPKSTVEAAMNTVEFAYREGNTGSYPRGLILMLNALTTWLYDHDPLALVAFEKPLNTIKNLYAENPHYFSELLEKYFARNDRKTLVILEPDPEMLRKIEEKIQEKLDRTTRQWTRETRAYFVEKTKALIAYQNQPDSPEDIAKIPRLERRDLDPEPPVLPRIVDKPSDGSLMILHPIETNGIVYIDVGFKFDGISQEHLPYLPLLCSALMEAGTVDEDYVQFTERIARHTGGIRPKIVVRNCFYESPGVYLLLLRGKVLPEKTSELVRIFSDMINKVNLDNPERIFQIILRHKAARYQRIIPEGHRIAMRRIRAHFSLADRVKEELSGLSQYFFVKELAENFDEKWPTIKKSLETLKESIFNRSQMVTSVTADGDLLAPTRSILEKDLLPKIKGNSGQNEANPLWNFPAPCKKEAFTLPVQVHYVASGGKLGSEGISPEDGSILVVMNYLRAGWLWEKIRVQGGAYGAHCFFDRPSAVLVMTSYRDPHLQETVDIMKKCHESISPEKLDAEDITRAVIGTFGKVDPPLFPDARAYVSLIRYLTGEMEEMRRNLRKTIIETDDKDFSRIAELLRKWSEDLHLCVLGPVESVENARRGILKDAEITSIEA